MSSPRPSSMASYENFLDAPIRSPLRRSKRTRPGAGPASEAAAQQVQELPGQNATAAEVAIPTSSSESSANLGLELRLANLASSQRLNFGAVLLHFGYFSNSAF